MSEKNRNRSSAGDIIFRRAILSLLLIAFAGCMSDKILESRKQFYVGNSQQAAKTLEEYKNKSGKDQVLALLEYGMAMHVAGKYALSNNALMAADKIIEQNNVVKVGETTGSMVSNDMVTTFKPESFERVLVHTYIAINFMLTDDWEAARVEAKKSLKILDSLDEDLQNQSFTRYVCALAFDVMGDSDSAYIEYKKVIHAAPEAVPVYRDLLRIASLRGDSNEAQKWRGKIEKRFGSADDDRQPANLIILVGAGRGPYKKEINAFIPPNLNRFVLPKYESSNSRAASADLVLNLERTQSAAMLTDVDFLAVATLDKRMPKIIAKQTARVIAKEAIAKNIEDQNILLGLGARAAFMASEAADIRCWETLPRYMGVITDRLPAGTYDLVLEFQDRSGMRVDSVAIDGVTITENRRTVLSVRSIR